MKGIIANGICVDFDPQGAHAEECGWWHGGVCDCRPLMRLTVAMRHCHECDFLNAYDGATPCSCKGICVCERDTDCPCVEDELRPRIHLIERRR
jgi:hypothetical protein